MNTKGKQSMLNIVLAKYGILISLLILIIFFAIQAPNFLSVRNITNLFRQISILSLLSTGLTCCMILNEFDLSVGEVAGLSGVLVTSLMLSGYSFVFSIVIVLILGFLIGLVNGLIVVKLKIFSFIVTLAMSSIALGFNYFISRGRPVYGQFPNSFNIIGIGYVAGIPFPTIISIGVLIIGIVFTMKTKYGRYMYAIGGNIIAAKHSGINTDWYRIIVMGISSLCAASGGIVLASRLGSGQPTAGSGYLMNCFAACFLGTAIFSKKIPTLLGTFIGVIIIGILSNGLTMISIPYYYENIIKGVVLIAAVSLTIFQNNSK